MKKELLLFLVLDMLCLSLSACNGSRDIPRETDADKPPEVQEPETYETAPELKELIFGEIPNLGLGTLAYTVPDKDDEDYRLYFFASESEEDRYRSLTEMNFDLSTAAYIFPDVREGNVSIGKLNGIYFIDTIDISGDPVDDVFVIATYEANGNEYYDTRVYEASENGYVVNAVLTQELNEKYYNVEYYPVEDLISLPDDSQMGFSRESSTVLTYEKEGEQEKKTATLYVGEGYSLYVTDGDWSLYGPGWWVAENDQRIRFFVSSYEGLNESQVERILTGYGYMAGVGYLWKQESDTMYKVRCCETETDAWTLEAVYPSGAEEFWGEEIWAMFETFETEEGYRVGDHTERAVMPEGEHLKLYEETYTDAASRAWAVHEPEYTGSYIYNQLTISNVTDVSFDFTITLRNFETEETETIYPLCTAYFNEDGVSATYTGSDGTLTFDFSYNANPLPVVLTIKLWGVESLEGIRFYCSNIPGYESD